MVDGYLREGRTKACTGRAYAVRRFLEVFGIHTFFVPPVMPDVELSREARRLVALRFSLVACGILFFCCARATYVLAS